MRHGGVDGATMERLVQSWEKAGYFYDPTVERDVIGELMEDPNVVSNYGKDVNSVTATQNAFDGREFSTWDTASLQRGLHLLEDRGYCVLENVVPRELIKTIREKCEIRSNALGANDDFEVAIYGNPPVNCEMIKPSPGRRHFLVRQTEYEEVLAPLVATATPLVHAYLRKHQNGYKRKPYLSELQIVVTEPLAVPQFWHRDNVSPGLTVAVPLMSLHASLGLTELLPYSHRMTVHSITGGHCEPINAGDILIYDGRLIHRGKQNLTYNRTRIMIVFRYDFEPPPGQGVVLTAWNAMVGNLLNLCGGVYNALP